MKKALFILLAGIMLSGPPASSQSFTGGSLTSQSLGAVLGPVAPFTPTLGVLTLSTSNFTTGQSAGTILATIFGKTSGSTISIIGSDTSGVFAVSGSNLIAGANFAAASVGTKSTSLVETLGTATNSPNATAISPVLAALHYYMTNASGGFILNASGGYIQIQ